MIQFQWFKFYRTSVARHLIYVWLFTNESSHDLVLLYHRNRAELRTELQLHWVKFYCNRFPSSSDNVHMKVFLFEIIYISAVTLHFWINSTVISKTSSINSWMLLQMCISTIYRIGKKQGPRRSWSNQNLSACICPTEVFLNKIFDLYLLFLFLFFKAALAFWPLCAGASQ